MCGWGYEQRDGQCQRIHCQLNHCLPYTPLFHFPLQSGAEACSDTSQNCFPDRFQFLKKKHSCKVCKAARRRSQLQGQLWADRGPRAIPVACESQLPLGECLQRSCFVLGAVGSHSSSLAPLTFLRLMVIPHSLASLCGIPDLCPINPSNGGTNL